MLQSMGSQRVGHNVATEQQLKGSAHSSNLEFYLLLGLLSEKAVATHSSTLAWKIPWMEEPGRL